MPKSKAWSPSPDVADHPAVVAMAGVRQLDGSVRDGIDVRPTVGLRCLGHSLGTDDFARAYFLEHLFWRDSWRCWGRFVVGKVNDEHEKLFV